MTEKKFKKCLMVEGKNYSYVALKDFFKENGKNLSDLPYSIRILAENILRHYETSESAKSAMNYLLEWKEKRGKDGAEMDFMPARVVMQDFTGVPAMADLAAMRDAMKAKGGKAKNIAPVIPVDLVIDHSINVDYYGSKDALQKNTDREFEINQERYKFLKWGQKSFENFRVVPPGKGIIHQINLEYLAKCVWSSEKEGKDGRETWAYPDTVVGTDSHTTMINGLSVLGWGVGGIEAEAAMLGLPLTMLIPEVIGMELTGSLQEGVTATDLVLTITQLLRKKGVVDKFVEFYGEGIKNLKLSDRATIANMAPEYGATCGLFPIDDETMVYLNLSGRSPAEQKLVEMYAKAQGMWRVEGETPIYTDTLKCDLSKVVPVVAGPKRPQDRIELGDISGNLKEELAKTYQVTELPSGGHLQKSDRKELCHGDVVIAAITSCTNTSNPSVLIAAGLVARKAKQFGLKIKPWVKSSLAPGSQVVTEYLSRLGLLNDFEEIGLFLAGYGCTTCIGNSGPLKDEISKEIGDKKLVVSAVLSGNRNFEGRVHPLVKTNYLASPPLVVLYALAGSALINLSKDPVAYNDQGKAVYMKDLWPTNKEISEMERSVLTRELFTKRYADVFEGQGPWNKINVKEEELFSWDEKSTYIKRPPFFEAELCSTPKDIEGAQILALFGDSITTDHISPAGNIKKESPAGVYLQNHHVSSADFNSYGARRGNHDVMMRGTFANIRIKNLMMGGSEGGHTYFYEKGTFNSSEQLPIYDASMKYQAEKRPLVIFAGKEYGTGSSRDWAAKGTKLLGVRAVVAESFERIHRSNLVGMGIIPLEFKEGENIASLKLKGNEEISILGLNTLTPKGEAKLVIKREDGSVENKTLKIKVHTLSEVEQLKFGGVLPFALATFAKKS